MIRVRGGAGAEQWNRVTTAVGYGSSSDRVAHFGMGADTRAVEIEIQWPGGGRQMLKDMAVDRVLDVEER